MFVLILALTLSIGIEARSFMNGNHHAMNTRAFGLEEILLGEFSSRGFSGTWISGKINYVV